MELQDAVAVQDSGAAWLKTDSLKPKPVQQRLGHDFEL